MRRDMRKQQFARIEVPSDVMGFEKLHGGDNNNGAKVITIELVLLTVTSCECRMRHFLKNLSSSPVRTALIYIHGFAVNAGTSSATLDMRRIGLLHGRSRSN